MKEAEENEKPKNNINSDDKGGAFQIGPSAIFSGGGASSAGDFALNSTIGQPLAESRVLAAARPSLLGLPGYTPIPTAFVR